MNKCDMIRKLLCIAIVLATAIIGFGCASDPNAKWEDGPDVMGYRWTVGPVLPPITSDPVMVITPTYEKYVSRCGVNYGHSGACTERRYDLNPPQCYIVSYRDVRGDTYLWWHERKHCKGYNH